MFLAVEKGNLKMVESLLNHPEIDVNIKSIVTKANKAVYIIKNNLNTIYILKLNMAPLHIAVEKGNSEIVEILLSSPKTNVNIKTIKLKIFLNSILIKFF